MGFFFENYTVLNVVCAILLIAGLILLNEITRRSKIASAIIYGAVPVVFFTLLILGKMGVINDIGSPSTQTWFGTVKTVSALLGVWGFLLIRHTKLGNTKFTVIFPVTILAINICEAVYRDIEVYMTYKTLTVDEGGLSLLGGYWNLFNAAAGVLLLLTMTGFMGIKIADTKSRDMVWADQLWFWIIAYDVWNAAYCYNCISTRAMYTGITLLISCTVAEFVIKRGIWLQHRAQTLAIFGMISLAFDYSATPAFNIVATYDPKAWGVLSVAAFAVNLAVFVYMIYKVIKTKRNPYSGELYTDLSAYQRNMEANGL